MPVTRSTPSRGGQGTSQSDDAWAEQVQPANNTAQAGDIQPTNNTAQAVEVQPANNTAQAGDIQSTNNTAQVHKAFHWDAFLFNLSNQGTTQWVIEQLSKEDANPSNFSPQHIKNLAKTIEQNRTTGQYLSTNANTGENASINLLRHQCTRISEKKYQKPNKSKRSQFNQQEQSPQPNKELFTMEL